MKSHENINHIVQSKCAIISFHQCTKYLSSVNTSFIKENKKNNECIEFEKWLVKSRKVESWKLHLEFFAQILFFSQHGNRVFIFFCKIVWYWDQEFNTINVFIFCMLVKI